MTDLDNVRHIQRIYNSPDHSAYGAARRLWLMLEQLFADLGGVERFEVRLHLYHDQVHGGRRLYWDEHLAELMRRGQTEPSAQRTVLQQLLVAREWRA